MNLSFCGGKAKTDILCNISLKTVQPGNTLASYLVIAHNTDYCSK